MVNKINNKPLKVSYGCIPCAIGSLINLFNKGLIPSTKQEVTMRSLLKHLSDVDFNQSPPALGREMHRIIRQVLDNPDPYKELKIEFNSLMLNYYPKLKDKVDNASDPFDLAVRLAIAGNVIDFGPNHSFDVNDTLKNAEYVTIAPEKIQELREAINKAKTLLYLGDNAGEIVLDQLFLETIKHPNVSFAVRGGPIINDITTEDAMQIGIDNIATIISNGDNAPGTILENVSPQFLSVFNEVDLIIAKGQGNYESLSGLAKNIYFLLMVKCDHVANHLGVNKGDFLVRKEQITG
jgi:damage-control phosphatase, subfamily I